MIKVSIQDVKDLREKTGAAVMDCRNALSEVEGDFEKAKSVLKKQGLARAEKKKEREIKAGKVISYIHGDGKVGVLVILGCETDFVAKTKNFAKLAHEICLQIAAMNPKNVKILLSQEYIRNPKMKIEDLVKETVGELGENIKIEEFTRLAI